MPLGRVLGAFQGPLQIYLRNVRHECIETGLLAMELHRQESVTFLEHFL